MDTQENLQPALTNTEITDEQSEKSLLTQYVEMNQAELIEAARTLISHKPISEIREQMDFIKQMFYKKKMTIADLDDAQATDVVDKNDENYEESFKEVLNQYKSLKASENAIVEKQLQDNLNQKNEILVQLSALINSKDDLSSTIPAFRKLQSEWKQIGHVPQTNENEVWKEYNHCLEQFYDLVKINNDLRDYDLKKNLELKTALCDAAEALNSETDIIKAFRMLQNLHEEWREIGPVLRDEREAIWTRFKDASTIINKKHQAYFDELKAEEEHMLEERALLCEKVENIDYQTLNSYKLWEDKTNEIISLNQYFKWDNPIGRRVNAKIYKRFRMACDKFFEARQQFFKASKDEFNENLNKKRELCEQAEALQNSTDWKVTTDKLVELQKQWKLIGPVPKKYSDVIWKRFVTACDAFFDNKDLTFSNKKNEENDNMLQKLALIQEIKDFKITGDDSNDLATLKDFSMKFNSIGHVPFKEKDKVYRSFKETIDKRYAEVKNQMRIQNIGMSKNRNVLMKKYDQLKTEIATYENNIGFFNNSTKANSIVTDMERKIVVLKQELSAVMEQIDLLDKQ